MVDFNLQQPRSLRWVALTLLFLMALPTLGCGLLPAAGTALAEVRRQQPALSTPAPVLIPAGITADDARRVTLYARANPGVVNITIYRRYQDWVVPQGGGSGFVYDEAGTIVTNAHVVREADQVDVTFADGTVTAGKILGQDPHSDLAVLRVDALPDGVRPLPLGEMNELAVGQTVVAIGNPFGLEGTLTEGIISALGRTIPALTPFSIPQAIQTDTAINPGNSGGPLLSFNGEVIGVNSQIETGNAGRTNSGVGFAVPVSIVRRVVPTLIEDGRYEWAWLGVRGSSVKPSLIEAMDLPVERGAYLAEVLEDGPAARARLRGARKVVDVDGRRIAVGGDIITRVDGQAVRSFDDLLIYIALETAPGDEITLGVVRDGKAQDVVVRPEAFEE